MRTRLLPLLPVLLVGVGCESDAAPPAAPPPPPPAIGTAFDPAACGAVTGRVTWTGPVPTVADFPNHAPQPDGTFVYRTAKNPNAPRIDAGSRGVAGAVVWLQGADPARAHPWDHPPAAVEVGNQEITVVQGGRQRVGFVRRGDAVTVASVEARYHVLRGRGDAFFSLTLPEPARPVTRTLGTAGRVELSSGSGQYWMRASLFVVGHPYYAVTDADGRFRFDRVPAGPVAVAVWHPNWEVERFERDPDSTMITRTVYKPPLERTAAATVARGGTAEVAVALP